MMAMSVRSGTLEMCIYMALLERRECAQTYSGANPSLTTPTQRVLALRTVMIYEALTERILWLMSE